MKLQLKKASTDVIVNIFIQDSSQTDGSGLTGLVYNSTNLVCYYVREGAAAAQLSLVTQTVTGAHADGGFVEIDATNTPGLYRLDLSDAILAAGVNSVVVMLKGATNMAPLPLEIQLTDFDLNTAKVQLADDTITAAAYDETTAWPITAADTGNTQLARTGADSDTLETLSDEIATKAPSGTALTNTIWTDAKANYLDANISSRNAITPPTVTQIRTEIDDNSVKLSGIQNDLNNPDQYKATGFAISGEYDTQMGYIPANLNEVPTSGELNSAHGAGGWETAVGFATENPPSQTLADYKATGFAVPGEYDTPMGYIPNNLDEVPTSGELNSVHGTGSWESDGVAPTVGEIRIEMDDNSVKLGYIPANMDEVPTSGELNSAHGAGSWEGGGAAPTVGEIRTEMDDNSVKLSGIQEDLDNPNQYKATGFAVPGEYDTQLGYIPSNLDEVPTSGELNSVHGTGGWETATGFATENPPSQVLADYKATGFATENPPSQTLNDYKATGFGVSGEYDSELTALQTDVSSILVDTSTSGVALSTAVKQAIANELLDLSDGIETGFTLKQATQVVAAACCSILSGAGTGTEILKGLDKVTTRATFTVDASGNRSAVIYNI